MGPNRNESRLRICRRRRQTGITAIGFVILATIFGVIALATLRVFPLYMERMKVSSVLSDMERDLSGNGGAHNATSLINEFNSRLYIESVDLPREDVSIRQVRNGYEVHVQHESRTEFAADLWFLVLVDEKAEITR